MRTLRRQWGLPPAGPDWVEVGSAAQSPPSEGSASKEGGEEANGSPAVQPSLAPPLATFLGQG